MVKKNLGLLLLVTTFLIPLSMAGLETGVDGIIGLDLNAVAPTFNNQTAFVNNSFYWQGYTPATLPHNLLDNLEWSVAGHIIDGNIDMNDNTLTDMNSLILSGTGYLGDWDGVLNIVNDLAPTNDLAMALGLPLLRWNNLSVGGVYADGTDSYFNRTLLIDGDIGAELADATLVINSGNNLYSCINLTEGDGHLGFQICNDGAGSNRLVFSNAHDGYEWFWIDRDEGTINFLNDTVFTNLIVEDVNSTGNISTEEYFIGDGSQLTGVGDAKYQFTDNNFNGSGDLTTTGDILANEFNIDATIDHEIYDSTDDLVIKNSNENKDIIFSVNNGDIGQFNFLTIDSSVPSFKLDLSTGGSATGNIFGITGTTNLLVGGFSAMQFTPSLVKASAGSTTYTGVESAPVTSGIDSPTTTFTLNHFLATTNLQSTSLSSVASGFRSSVLGMVGANTQTFSDFKGDGFRIAALDGDKIHIGLDLTGGWRDYNSGGAILTQYGIYLKDFNTGSGTSTFVNYDMWSENGGDWVWDSDNQKLRIGATQGDLDIYSDGTDGVINTTGVVKFVNETGYSTPVAHDWGTASPSLSKYNGDLLSKLKAPNEMLDNGKIDRNVLTDIEKATTPENDPNNCWEEIDKYCWINSFNETICEEELPKHIKDYEIIYRKECGTRDLNITLTGGIAMTNKLMISELKQRNEDLKRSVCHKDFASWVSCLLEEL